MKEMDIKVQAFKEENTTNSTDISFMIQDFLNSGISLKTIEKYQNMGYLTETESYWKLHYPELYENKITDYWNIRYKKPNPNKGKYVKPKGQTSRLFRPLDLSPDILRNPKKGQILKVLPDF